MGEARVKAGDCLESMRGMDAGSVRCCVTSPPYWGLRDYGHDGQLGLEATPDEYVAKLVAVFSEVRRVLADDGTLWLNLGDSYASSGDMGAHRDCSGGFSGRDKGTRGEQPYASSTANVRRTIPHSLKPKDLCGIPWRVAFALQADGWWLRQDIIWHKPNPMPESVTDRCTKAHEYMFLLSKAARYYYDHEAVKESAREKYDVASWLDRKNGGATGGCMQEGGNQQHGDGCSHNLGGADGTRNRRSVWTIPTSPFPGAHFAVFPPKLVEPCILAGSAEGDTVLDPFCGSGTTGMVALQHGRRFVGCELNAEYAEMARERIHNDAPLLNCVL